MTLDVNYLAIITSAITAMIIGAIWYGPLFGKKWMEIIQASCKAPLNESEIKKAAAPLYALQFLLVFFQVWVLAYLMNGWEEFQTPLNIMWIWAAFVVPTIAGSVMWNSTPAKIRWQQFLIQSGYQLVIFIVFGVLLVFWK